MRLFTIQLRQILRMRQISMGALTLVAVAAFTSFTSGTSGESGHSIGAASNKADVSVENKLIGTWKQVKARFGGKDHKPLEGSTQLKHITPTHFMFIDIDKDGNVFDALGGPYTLKGDKYEETPEYGGGTISEVFKKIKGKPQAFECKVEGNKWYHNGTLTNGLTIEEVWERVDPK